MSTLVEFLKKAAAEQHWGSGPLFLALGITIGAIAVWLASRRTNLAADRDMQLRDLDERIEHAVAQLRDLQLQVARIEPGFFAEQKVALEGMAAQALRERDDVVKGVKADVIDSGPDRAKRVKGSEVSRTVAWFDARPWARPLVGILGVFAVLAVLAYSLATEHHEREPQRGPMQTAGGQQGGPDAEVQAMIARLQKDPKDVDAMVTLTKRLLRAQMFEEAAQMIARIRAVEPGNASAKVFSAVMLAAQGQGVAANEQLDAVTRESPGLADGWFFRGMLAMQAGDTSRMRESFERYLGVAPEGPQKERIRGMLGQ